MWAQFTSAETPDYNRFHLQMWRESSNPSAPLIIVIPGFLTQEHPETPFEGWSEPFINLAQERDLSVGGLYWPSGTLSDFYNGVDFSKYSGSDIIKIGPRVLQAWQTAVAATEQAGRNFEEWLPRDPRPIILVGHSLGARLALIAAQHVEPQRLHGVVALASAYESRLCDYALLSRGVKTSPLIAYSSNDRVLQTLFIVGQNPELISMGVLNIFARVIPPQIALPILLAKYAFDYVRDGALGLVGVPSEHAEMCTTWDLSGFKHISFGHTDYVEHLPDLLQDYKILKLINEASDMYPA